MRKIKTYLSGGGNLPQACLFLTVLVVVGKLLVVPRTPSNDERSLVVWLEEVGGFGRLRLVWPVVLRACQPFGW